MGKKKGKAKGAPKPNARYSQARQFSSPFGTPRRSQMQEAILAVTQKFSLREEARYMSNHRSAAFDSSKKLRHMPVAFVSAGCLVGTVEEKPPQTEPVAPSSMSPSQSPAAAEALAQMTIRSPSPALSAVSDASSEELIVFRGRGPTSLTQGTPKSVPSKAKSTSSVAPLTEESQPESESVSAAAAPSTDIHSLKGASSSAGTFHTEAATPFTTMKEPSISPEAASAQRAGSSNATRSNDEPDVDIDSDTNDVVDSVFSKRRGGKARWEGKTEPWVSRSKPGVGWLPVKDRPKDTFATGAVGPEDAAVDDQWQDTDTDPRDAAMDDYMQNAEAFGLTSEMVGFSSRRELDLDAGSHNNWDSDKELEIPPNLEPDDDGWTSDMLRDLDDHSTSNDVEHVIARIRRRRVRGTDVHYLVQYEDYAKDDFRWLPAVLLTKPSDKVLIEAFEAERLAREQQDALSSSDSEDEFDIDGESSEEEEALSDEQLARALQKQQELGIDDDELVLYGADGHFGSPGGMGSQASRTTFDRPNKRRQQRAGGGRRTEPSFPSATAMADALDYNPYDGFDIMDTERPSLRPKKKGRRGQPPPELDDSDLNEQLHAAWDADRSKKRLKKAEREELRRQGLLGRKGKAPDLSVKYKDGFVMDDVIEEIRDFWATADMPTLSLPSMEAHRRAVIHQFVSEFGINSKSQGDGVKRHTILAKTVRTLAFDDDLFDQTLSQHKYSRRLRAVSKYALPQQKKEKGPKGSKKPTVSYKDGEVVGAKAPELGVENKGRAMLEKMGWSKGMALGAVDNKGILQPITHTVKITKAGLR